MSEYPEKLNNQEIAKVFLESEFQKKPETSGDLVFQADQFVESLQKDGQARMKKIEKSMGITDERKEVEEKLAEISQKSQSLLEIFKKKMKMATAIGMATMAIGGAIEGINANEASGYNTETKSNSKIEEASGDNFEKKENNGYILLKTEGSLEEKVRKDKETKSFIEAVKKTLTDYDSKKEFLERLTIEFDGDEQRAIKEQAKRIENVKSVNVVVIENESEFQKKLEELRNEGRESNGDLAEFKGVYVDDKHTIYAQRDFTILGHELIHSETKGKKDISENAKKILADRYLKQGFMHIFSDKDDEYFSDVSEMLAAKKNLDIELKFLNIKGFDEKFTKEHYDKTMEYWNKGKLSPMSMEFIKRIKPGFESFKKIFDEIANSKDLESDFAKQA